MTHDACTPPVVHVLVAFAAGLLTALVMDRPKKKSLEQVALEAELGDGPRCGC